MRDPSLVHVTGVLAPFAHGFDGRLERLGYAPGSRAGHLRLMAQLSVWLDAGGLDRAGLTPHVVDEFVAGRRAAGHRYGRSPRSLTPMLEYLREAGAVPPAAARPVAGVVETMLADYASYLSRERGLSALTIELNVSLIRPFLSGRVIDGWLPLDSLTAADVAGFMLPRGRSVAPATVQRTATALRSLLGFLHLQGITCWSLVSAVPAAARWRLAGLPKYLTAEQVHALLAACDPSTPVGRRDLAIRLGLRAGEVAGLRLDDIDWRCGEIAVSGKGNRHERLPLPVDVGEAVVAYLTESRPTTAEVRTVFVGPRAPHRALTRGAVTQVVARAARRAGLGTIYAHRLRHTAATAMLAAGASLTEIGQVLRPAPADHRRIHADLAITGGTRANRSPRRQARPLPALRHDHGLPRRPVTTPTTPPGTSSPAAPPGGRSE
ncbi:tyrosine-type recombinase/integrase [Pseudonocardia saturnea]